MGRVHPRACGGNFCRISLRWPSMGPSPRVRGKRRPRAGEELVERSIPARAGETLERTDEQLGRPVHPRACGGNPGETFDDGLKGGPSPRVRGKPDERWQEFSGRRSIPARAGETRAGVTREALNKVHPRACGGNDLQYLLKRHPEGPSPRVRGKRGGGVLYTPDLRSIPARAGETWRGRALHPRSTVHPRACGGNVEGACSTPPIYGPSPRVRGKRPHDLHVRPEDGSIPARAGETAAIVPTRAGVKVHPRACGGNCLRHRSTSHMRGPSPRVRGKRTRARRTIPRGGSIPARAGETARRAGRMRRPSVHPRACGGNVCASSEQWRANGPSPRVRGKPTKESFDAAPYRSIPARAGETIRWPSTGPPRRVHPRACGGNRGIPPSPSSGLTVHPRACGGNQGGVSDGITLWGPSPRVRGKPSSTI